MARGATRRGAPGKYMSGLHGKDSHEEWCEKGFTHQRVGAKSRRTWKRASGIVRRDAGRYATTVRGRMPATGRIWVVLAKTSVY
jgi:hypothetical protein